MIQSLIHSSESNNLYIYDYKFRLSMLTHPEFVKVYNKGEDPDPYYTKKYEYLKKYGFFSNPKPINFGNFKESVVKDSIAQTSIIVFEVTDMCNLDCTYCSFGELYKGFDTRNHKNIDTERAIKLLRYVFDLKPKNKKNKLVIGFYGGEPLINARFIAKIIEVVNQLKAEKELNVEFNMTTNATLLHKHIHFLHDNNFQLLISLDGDEKNHSHRSFRVNDKNSFSEVIRNIDLLKVTYPEYFDKRVNFNAVLHDKNSVKEIYEFIYTRYQKSPRIAELSPYNINTENESVHNKIFHDRYKSIAEYQNEENNLLPHSESNWFNPSRDFLKRFSINFYVSNLTNLLHDVEMQLPIVACLPGQKKIFLTTRNKLLPCEKVDNKFCTGEIGENVVFDIPAITKQYNYYLDCMIKNCQNCYDQRFCKTCLFQMNNLDQLGLEEFVCEGFTEVEAFKRRLYHIFSFLERNPADCSQMTESIII